MKKYQMSVSDVFRLADGTTIFTGNVLPEAAIISAGECEVVFQNKVVTLIYIDGEIILKNSTATQRAISTSQRLDLDDLGLEQGGFIVRLA